MGNPASKHPNCYLQREECLYLYTITKEVYCSERARLARQSCEKHTFTRHLTVNKYIRNTLFHNNLRNNVGSFPDFRTWPFSMKMSNATNVLSRIARTNQENHSSDLGRGLGLHSIWRWIVVSRYWLKKASRQKYVIRLYYKTISFNQNSNYSYFQQTWGNRD